MSRVKVKKHYRKGKNKKSVVRSHTRDRQTSLTHRTYKGKRQVFVDGFWKHDDYPDAPKPGWSYERLVKERESLQKDLNESLYGIQILPHRKFGLLTRRIKKIDRILKTKKPNQ